MAIKYVLDAHALIWYLEGNSRLGGGARKVLDDAAAEMIVPIIALCEIIHVISKGRVKIKSAKELLDQIGLDPRFEIAPLSESVLNESLALQIPEMHDRLIVATALSEQKSGHQISLVTCDASIKASDLVPTIW